MYTIMYLVVGRAIVLSISQAKDTDNLAGLFSLEESFA